jgi:hypothetical protein
VKFRRPNAPCTWLIFLCPHIHASPRTCLHSASSVLAAHISCSVMTVLVFRKPLFINKLTIFMLFTRISCYIQHSVSSAVGLGMCYPRTQRHYCILYISHVLCIIDWSCRAGAYATKVNQQSKKLCTCVLLSDALPAWLSSPFSPSSSSSVTVPPLIGCRSLSFFEDEPYNRERDSFLKKEYTVKQEACSVKCIT